MLHLISSRRNCVQEVPSISSGTNTNLSQTNITDIPEDLLVKLCLHHLDDSGALPLSLVSKKFDQLIQQKLNQQTSVSISSNTHIELLRTFPDLVHLQVQDGLSDVQIDALITVLPDLKKLANLEVVKPCSSTDALRLFIKFFNSTLDLRKIIRRLDFSLFHIEHQTFFQDSQVLPLFSSFNELLYAALSDQRLSGIQSLSFKGSNFKYAQMLVEKFSECPLPNLTQLDFDSILSEHSSVGSLVALVKTNTLQPQHLQCHR